MSRSADKKQKVIVVVDPYSSGKYLVQELLEQCWKLVAIQSSLDLADFWLEQLEKDSFIETFVHETMEKTLEMLSKYDIQGVTPGSEPGVFLAEDLGEEMKMEKRNGGETSQDGNMINIKRNPSSVEAICFLSISYVFFIL